MRLTLRYDMRNPSFGASAEELYQACIEQCEWGDRLGFETVYLAEHHGADDGYCPSPMILASAILARTKAMMVHFSALLAPLHEPIRFAEDLAILDVISKGRIEMTLGLGYRPHEYKMFGVEQRDRVSRLNDLFDFLEKAWTGEPFEYRGETIVIRPRPVQRPRPHLYQGGSAPASAIRAATRGDNYFPAGDGTLRAIYEEERRRLGLPVPPGQGARGPLFLHVTDDPERDWEIVAPHVIYTSQSNATWAKERGVGATPYPPVSSVDDLKRNPQFAVVTPAQCVALAQSLAGDDAELTFQPIMGGLPSEVAWRSLHLFESAVLPELQRLGLRPAR